METLVKEHHQGLLPPADLPGDIASLRDDLRNEREHNLRTLADFKNYRRRCERDSNKHAEDGKREVILPLLEVVDDLEKALKYATDETPFCQGVRIIYHKCLALLETHGVRPFRSVGTPFDHNRHDAVAFAPPDNSEPGTVVDELRCGYLWNNDLLRPAQVRVA